MKEHGTKNEKQNAQKKYTKGTDLNPVSTEYYDILEVDVLATQAEIRKSYYKLAMKYHPDKNVGQEAEDKFKKIAEAYQVLSDPKLRQKYNEYGPDKGVTPDGGFSDPQDLFKMFLGGERFADLIGDSTIGRLMSDEMETQDVDDSEIKRIKQKVKEKIELSEYESKVLEDKKKAQLEKKKRYEKERTERIEHLTKILINKLKVAEQFDMNKVETNAKFEAEELKNELNGVELLRYIGSIYTLKAKRYIGNANTFKFFAIAKETGYTIKDAFNTINDGITAYKSFKQLSQKAQLLNEETPIDETKKAEIEAELAIKGIEAMLQTSKIDLFPILSEVCHNAIVQGTTDKKQRLLRAQALLKIGQIYQSVEPDPSKNNIN